ncbi:MAG: NADP-dependent oxidoreductase [Acidimicrobiales bacterium]
MTEATNRQLILVDRPVGPVGDENFELRTGPVPEPGPGQVLVETVWIGFDPTQRGWLNDVPSYIPPVPIGDPMRASGVGRVVASNDPAYAEGDWVSGLLGWQDYSVQGPGIGFGINKVPDGIPPQAVLSIYGTTGMTAYFGMLDLGKPEAGETVFVSGAAGSTGSIALQIAKLQGATVIGSAGGARKCEWVTDVAGADACIDYKSEDTQARLRELAPKGLNLYFDNVGGPTLEAALANIAMRARIVLCGGISSGYGVEELPPGPRNYMQLVIMRARMEGFIVIDYMDRYAEGIKAMSEWVANGDITYTEQVAEGLENCPATLRGLFEGANLGKQLLKVRD